LAEPIDKFIRQRENLGVKTDGRCRRQDKAKIEEIEKTQSERSSKEPAVKAKAVKAQDWG
jgi:hypothetical protein